MRLHEALEFAASQNSNEDSSSMQSRYGFFLQKFERGSKSFRRSIQFTEVKRCKIENLNTIKTFMEICILFKPDKKSFSFALHATGR